MSALEDVSNDQTIVVASNNRGANSSVYSKMIETGTTIANTNSGIHVSGSSDKPVESNSVPEARQSMEHQFISTASTSVPTPMSFTQMMDSNTNKASVPEIARTGGRRSRGIRHRGSLMMGGSMSVFSVRPDGPRTPTSRSRGSVRSKPSRGSNGNNKRKRSDGKSSSDSESSENFTPLSQSRSGRKIIHVNNSTPNAKGESDSKQSPKTSEKTSPSATISISKVVEKKRPSSKKTPGGASAVCKNCGRLHSPESNAMVFCDGCNIGWHQHCHDPPIPQDIVLIESKEWFCTDCIVLKEEKIRLQGKVSGKHMSLFEKRRHLQTLSSKELVSLLLHACSVDPDLAVFSASSAEPAEDLYDDEDVLPYPKPGNGLVLPPEKDHLHFLLDDDIDVYSHCTSGIAQLVAAARANMLRRNIAAQTSEPFHN